MDEIQNRLRPVLAKAGFKKHGRTLNRVKPDGLVDVVHFQMGAYDPPGVEPIPGFRESLYGQFTVNLGVYVPEAARWQIGREARGVVRETDCCVRTRLGASAYKDRWWPIKVEEQVTTEIFSLLNSHGFPLFAKYGTRELILSELHGLSANTDEVVVPRILCAIILAERGELTVARELLSAQAWDAAKSNVNHEKYVRQLAARMRLAIPEA